MRPFPKKWVVLAFAISGLFSTYFIEARAETSGLRGPSMHLFFGIRDKKAPNLDEYDTFLGGVRFSIINVSYAEGSYLSILAPGVGFQRNLKFIVGLSPLIVNHESGIGISFDLYPVSTREDRSGGPFGLSLNIDVIQLANFMTK